MKSGDLTKKIEAYVYPEDATRDYIGASSIGSDCLRQIWYEFKGYKGENFTNKLKRTWEIGKILETMILDLLCLTGLRLERNVKINDLEFPFFQGHMDAVWIEDYVTMLPIAIIEIKTAKDAEYNKFIKVGLKKWQPKYYAQIQSYMGMSGIHKAFIVVLNKDTSVMFDEYIEFIPAYYELMKAKAQYIHDFVGMPPRVHNSPLWFQCKMCKFNKVCHEK